MSNFMSLYWACDYLSILGLKLIHISYRDLEQNGLYFAGDFFFKNKSYFILIPILLKTQSTTLVEALVLVLIAWLQTGNRFIWASGYL